MVEVIEYITSIIKIILVVLDIVYNYDYNFDCNVFAIIIVHMTKCNDVYYVNYYDLDCFLSAVACEDILSVE